jgi:hypothetical protein
MRNDFWHDWPAIVERCAVRLPSARHKGFSIICQQLPEEGLCLSNKLHYDAALASISQLKYAGPAVTLSATGWDSGIQKQAAAAITAGFTQSSPSLHFACHCKPCGPQAFSCVGAASARHPAQEHQAHTTWVLAPPSHKHAPPSWGAASSP